MQFTEYQTNKDGRRDLTHRMQRAAEVGGSGWFPVPWSCCPPYSCRRLTPHPHPPFQSWYSPFQRRYALIQLKHICTVAILPVLDYMHCQSPNMHIGSKGIHCPFLRSMHCQLQAMHSRFQSVCTTWSRICKVHLHMHYPLQNIHWVQNVHCPVNSFCIFFLRLLYRSSSIYASGFLAVHIFYVNSMNLFTLVTINLFCYLYTGGVTTHVCITYVHWRLSYLYFLWIWKYRKKHINW